MPEFKLAITSDVGSSITIEGSSLPQFVSAKVTKEKATTFKILKIDFFIFSLIWLLILYKEIE